MFISCCLALRSGTFRCHSFSEDSIVPVIWRLHGAGHSGYPFSDQSLYVFTFLQDPAVDPPSLQQNQAASHLQIIRTSTTTIQDARGQ